MELLEPYAMQTKDEKLLHLYLGAGAVQYHHAADYPKVYTDIVDRYIQLYPEKYKSWIDMEYQLLRESAFKSRFCKQ